MTLAILIPLALAQPSADLRLQFVAGEESVWRLTMERSVAQKSAEQRPFTTRSLYDVRRSVVRATELGGVVRYRFERLIHEVSGSPKDGRVDTAEKQQKGEPAELAILRNIVGKQFEAEMDSRGALLKFDAVGSSKGASDGLAESTMRILLQSQSGWMPESAKSFASGSWKKKDQTSIGALTLVRNSTWKTSSQSSPIVDVEGTTEFTHRPAEPTSAGGGKFVLGTLLPGPPSTMRVRFDAKRGRLQSLSSEISLEMRVDAFARDAKTPSESVFQSLSARTKLEMISPSMASPVAN